MVAELLNQYISRLTNSIAGETTYIQDWRAGVPDYRAPTITLESSFWEITDSKEQSHLGKRYLPHFYPVKLHGPGPTGPIPAINRRLLAVVDRYGIPVNKIHSFMQYLPVKFVIQTLLIELELVLGGADSIELDYDWIIRSVSSHVRQSNRISRQSQLGTFTPGGLDYANRCLVTCMLKLIALHEHAGFFWNLANGQVLFDIFLAVIEMFREAWASFQLQSGPGSIPEDWMRWSFTYDPWIAGDGFYTLESRPVQDFYLPKSDFGTKNNKSTPPWGK